MNCLATSFSPTTCPLVKPEVAISGDGGALPTCVPPLRRAPPPEGERMSFAQLSLLEPHAPRPRLRHVRRPFTPPCEGGPYRLPHDVRDRLGAALTSCRNRDDNLALAVFVGRFWSAPGRIEQAFPLEVLVGGLARRAGRFGRPFPFADRPGPTRQVVVLPRPARRGALDRP